MILQGTVYQFTEEQLIAFLTNYAGVTPLDASGEDSLRTLLECLGEKGGLTRAESTVPTQDELRQGAQNFIEARNFIQPHPDLRKWLVEFAEIVIERNERRNGRMVDDPDDDADDSELE